MVWYRFLKVPRWLGNTVEIRDIQACSTLPELESNSRKTAKIILELRYISKLVPNFTSVPNEIIFYYNLLVNLLLNIVRDELFYVIGFLRYFWNNLHFSERSLEFYGAFLCICDLFDYPKDYLFTDWQKFETTGSSK